ncbi:4'-phosphopantetheinyl transferase family protein [Lysobacter niastensis]|uniref:4'-phosphopantetheinyl transferase superfamily protein n=1 Tax=Lysobacter niastensis TaxID=380629 RepID=A0ABS0BE87_9GAMM|nr:4'-phosphopantetheinyl transferase superfamily protein [Lysobacter niastensis]MBF6025999.1 4'-phosphopantetheinyl transferase superfamily protein [Lysobacter niastensis]
MSDSLTISDRESVRWAWLPHQPRQPGEPLARAWLGEALGIAADALPLVRDERGRPRFVGGLAGWDCNWSHSGDGLVVALGEGVQLGIDLERLRPRARALELAARFFTPPELDWLHAAPSAAVRDHAFLRLWCAKEAVLKAHGQGISFGLHRLRFGETGTPYQPGGLCLVECDPELGEPSQWRLKELQPAPDYLGALAWRER